jgi:hypothetical protein
MVPIFDVFNPPFKFVDLYNAPNYTTKDNQIVPYWKNVYDVREMEIEYWLNNYQKAYNIDLQKYVWRVRYPRISGKPLIKWTSENPPMYADGVPFWTPRSRIVFSYSLTNMGSNESAAVYDTSFFVFINVNTGSLYWPLFRPPVKMVNISEAPINTSSK